MEINGPLKIGVIDTDSGNRELHLGFTAEFRAMNATQQNVAFRRFIAELSQEITQLDEKDPNRQGMMTILQISEQLLPHIEANEIPLEETIVVDLQTHNPFGNIVLSN